MARTAFITGGTRGLGFAIAQKLVSEGLVVHTIGTNPANVEHAVAEIKSDKFHAYQCDVRDFNALQKLADTISAIDILINNTGIWLEGDITTNSIDDISKIIDINVKGTIYSTKAFLPLVKASSAGVILNISSTTGLKAKAGQAVYAATKFAVSGFGEALKEDLRDTKVKVINLYPGGMNTNIFSQAGYAKENQDWMHPSKVAKIIWFLIDQDETMNIDHVVVNKRQTRTSN